MSTTVELRELGVFLTLVEELHFGRTAERLGLTPSRVSQITDLPPLRSALVWRRGLTDPTVREFIRIARDVVRSRRRG